MSRFFVENLLQSCDIRVEEMRSFFPQVRIRSFDAGDVLIQRGAEDSPMIFVVTGLVLATVNMGNQVHTPVMAIPEGQWIGAQSIMAGSTADFSYIAAGETSVLEFPHPVAHAMMATSSPFTQFVVQLCLQETARYPQMLIPMRAGGPAYRVVTAMALLAETFEQGRIWRQRLMVPNTQQGVTVELPQSTLAALCGVSRSVLSPVLQPLKKHGWLDVQYGRTRICRPDLWSRLAEIIRTSLCVDADMRPEWAVSQLQSIEAATHDPGLLAVGA
jgi:CRP/FNR family cyclic AMP-dependent transcriptional regulator